MMPSNICSVSEAADRLAVNPSRVRALLAHGQLMGAKVGGRWLVSEESIRARQRLPGERGRPLACANAWNALLLGSGVEPRWPARAEAKRMVDLLDKRGLAALAPRLGKRAQPRRFYAHPGVLRELANSPRLVPTGASAAVAHGLGLVAGEELDAYVPDEAVQALVDEFALDPRVEGGNVVLRALPQGVWPFVDDVAPVAAVALDLAEHPDARSMRIGRQELARLDREHPWLSALES